MSEEILIVEYLEGGICRLTLNRPDRMNALTLPLLRSLKETVENLRFNREVRVVLITGAGEKAFCAGADLKERVTMTPDQVKVFVRTIRDTFTAIENLNKPTIAVVNGVALGGGTELALACDSRVIGQGATMGLTETSLGIIPGAGGTQRLPRLVGKGRAKDLILTARRVGADEALRIGLAEYSFSNEQLQNEAEAIARRIAANAPLALEQAKFAVDKGLEMDIASALDVELKCYELIIPTQDRLEGLKAFAEKRSPVYKGE